MESRNPILRNSETFNGRAVRSFGHPEYPASGAGYPGYGQATGAPAGSDPRTWQIHTGGDLQEPMTIDSVVSRTALTLFLVVVTAALTWIFLPDSSVAGEANYVTPAWIGGALVGAGVGLLLSVRRVISPALVAVYAVAEGVFLGAMSEWFDTFVYHGIVIEAVMGTMAAFLVTLAAYKFLDIKVTSGFRKWLNIVGIGFFVVVFGDFLISLFGTEIGFNGFGPLGLIMSFVGLGLGVAYLIADFDMIERGVAAGAPDPESWRAAFALTAALVLIYVELLRILAIFNRS
jgi:uncharacterized YccA/Bax inhibitor family protein